jgi:LysR family transcriptional regulator, benzoate and cis,cis-muconate-responsive activator of ben and cat genes
MELRHLRYFVAVAEEENVSRAASKLHVSQPGISRQIHDLEDEIGFLLFERSGRSVRLTVAGRIFFGEARDILQRTADAVKKARAGLASQAEINVGYAPSGTVEILPRALRAFRRSFPAVRVTLHDLSVKEMLPMLLQKKLDIALTLPPHKLPRELDMKELARYEACVVVGTTHPLAKLKFVSLNQMASEPVAALARKDYPHYHKHLEKLFATIGRKPCISSEHDSGTSLIAAVAAGHEFTLLPSCVSGAAGTRLKLLKLRPALPPWSIVALWRKDNETQSVRAFIAAALAKPAKDGWLPQVGGWVSQPASGALLEIAETA